MDIFPKDLGKLKFRLTIDDVQGRSEEQKAAIRLACQTNLRFLQNCILRPPNERKFPTMIEGVHGRIIDALPKCDPNKELEDWDSIKEFIVMASRGMLKSTIGASFLTQVMLCAPDVRILILSGKLDKAESILSVARNPFCSNHVIRHLFPEWAVDYDDVQAKEFTCPKRNSELNFREPTIEIATFDSVKAGGHYELLFFDDATNEINSGTIENALKTHDNYDDTDPLVDSPGSYRVLLATKWQDDDLPEYIRKKGEEEKEKTGKDCVSFFYLPAWVLRTDGTPLEAQRRADREKTGSLVPDDVILTWPEKLTSEFLFKLYRKNRSDFYKQYLLDASVEQQKSFTPEILQRQIQSPNELQNVPIHDRAVVVHWDLATVFSGRRKKSETDFSCGVIAVFQKSTGKMFVVDTVMEHFNTGDDIGHALVRLYQVAAHFGPIVGHSMEDAVGSRNLESTINRIARESVWPPNLSMKSLYWLIPDSAPNAKNRRIAILASAMDKGFVAVMSNVRYINDLKSQFEKWSIDAKRRKDDGPDCIAQIWQHYRHQIIPDAVKSLTPTGPILSWEPDPQDPVEPLDPHLDERENADIEWLSSFTAPHAEI